MNRISLYGVLVLSLAAIGQAAVPAASPRAAKKIAPPDPAELAKRLEEARSAFDRAKTSGNAVERVIEANNLGVALLRSGRTTEAVEVYRTNPPTSEPAMQALTSAYQFNYARALETQNTPDSLRDAAQRFQGVMEANPQFVDAARGLDRTLRAATVLDWARSDRLVVTLLEQADRGVAQRPLMRVARDDHLKPVVDKWKKDPQFWPVFASVLRLFQTLDDPDEVAYTAPSFSRHASGNADAEEALREIGALFDPKVDLYKATSGPRLPALHRVLHHIDETYPEVVNLARSRLSIVARLAGDRFARARLDPNPAHFKWMKGANVSALPARAVDRYRVSLEIARENEDFHAESTALTEIARLVLRYGKDVYPPGVAELVRKKQQVKGQGLRNARTIQDWSDILACRIMLARLTERFPVGKGQGAIPSATWWEYAINAEEHLVERDPKWPRSIELRAELARALGKNHPERVYAVLLEAAALAVYADKSDRARALLTEARLAAPKEAPKETIANDFRASLVSEWSHDLGARLPSGWRLTETNVTSDSRADLTIKNEADDSLEVSPTLAYRVEDGVQTVRWAGDESLATGDRSSLTKIVDDGWARLTGRLKTAASLNPK